MNRALCLAAPALLLALTACSGDDAGCPDEKGTACRWAGTGRLGYNKDGKDRLRTDLYWPLDVEFAPDATPWILDWNNHMIRRIRPDRTVETIVGQDVPGDGPSDQSDLMPPGAPGLEVALNHPTDIQFEPDGTLVFAAWHNHKIRHVDPDSGQVLVVCGRGAGYAGDGSAASSPAARFNQPKSIVLSPDGTLYILDQRNHRIRAIAADGTLSTIAGNGMAGFGGDGGDPLAAQLHFEAGGNPEPSGALALDAAGRLYVSDGLNHRIRRIDFAANTIETIAGTGEPGFSGDGGQATAAQVNNPRDLEIGPDGRLYLADTENNRIRVIDLATGIITTLAGHGDSIPEGNEIRYDDEGDPLRMRLDRPFGIAFGPDHALYISDTFNSRIVRLPL